MQKCISTFPHVLFLSGSAQAAPVVLITCKGLGYIIQTFFFFSLSDEYLSGTKGEEKEEVGLLVKWKKEGFSSICTIK